MSASGPSELAHALAAHLGRRRAFGARRLPRVAPPAARRAASAALAAPPSPPQAVPRPAPPPAPEAGPRPGPPVRAQSSAPKRPTPKSPAPKEAAPIESAKHQTNLDQLMASASACTACGLSGSRQAAAPGSGAGHRRVLFVDEAPGADGDRTGSYFEGPSGELLGAIVTKGMGLGLDDVHVTGLVKCQPRPGAAVSAAELATCRAWLDRQIELLDPLVIITLGRPAAEGLLGVQAPLGRLRGQVHALGQRKVVATYHPTYLVRAPHEKRKAWEDIQLAMATAGLPLPGA